MERNVTRECTVRLETALQPIDAKPLEGYKEEWPNDVLIYLYHDKKPIGLFDLNGFHLMDPKPEGYKFQTTSIGIGGIGWFTITKDEEQNSQSS